MHSSIGRKSPANLIFLSALVVLALGKLFIVADANIVAIYRPHDDFWYISAANSLVWGGVYSSLTLAHLQIYAIIIAIIGELGAPLRFTSELALIGGALFLISALRSYAIPAWACVVSFALIIFHPDTLMLLDYSFAEVGAAIITLFFVAALLNSLRCPEKKKYSVILAIATAMLWFCRDETGPLLAALIGAIAIAIGVRHVFLGRRDNTGQLTLALVVIPLFAVTVTWLALSSLNQLAYGVFAPSDFSANFLRANKALQSIDAGSPRRFVPVSKAARTEAYRVSPALTELRPYLDGAVENWGATAGRSSGFDGEIGAGWFHWALRAAVESAGYYRDAASADAFYRRIADELEVGFKDGRLKRRPALLPLIDNSIGLWAPHLPRSALGVAAMLFPDRISEFQTGREGSASADPTVTAIVDNAARRSAAKTGRVALSGWLLPTRSPLIEIDLVDPSGASLPSQRDLYPRPDVPPVRTETGAVIESVGFSLAAASSKWMHLRLRMKTADGQLFFSEPLSALALGQVLSVGQNLNFALDRLDGRERRVSEWRKRSQTAIVTFYPRIWLGVIALVLVNAIVGWKRCGGYMTALRVAAISIFGFMIISRIGVFAIIDASAWNGQQIRYMFPVALLFVTLPCLLAYPTKRTR